MLNGITANITDRSVKRIMIIYHCKAKTGYAIETLERTFWETAKTITGNVEDIHLCYKSYSSGYPNYTPLGFNNFYQLDPTESDTKKISRVSEVHKKSRHYDHIWLRPTSKPVILPIC